MSEPCDGINEKLYSMGRVVVDGSLHTQSADETFFRYFGNGVIYSIRRIFDDRDFLRIEDAMEASADGTIRRTAVRVKDISGEIKWISAAVRRIGTGDSEEPLYRICFNDIFALEKLAYSRQSRISEYRYILSLVSDIAFEYSFETKKIRIYMFDCCRENVLVEEDLEKWRKDSIESGFILSRYIETFNSFCKDIMSGVYRFEYEIETSVLTLGRAKELCLFKGITRFDDPENKKVTGIISVVSSWQRTKEVNLALESNRDSLSGLLNKRAVTDYAKKLIASEPNENVHFVLLDIDRFTDINNSYGHLFGDEVIYTIAGIVKNETGTRGVAGRISGGGFLIVLEGINGEEDLRGVLRAIRTNTECAFAERFEKFRLTCSMGVSTYPVDSADYDELFMQADKALYIAQQKGCNRYVIYDVSKHGAVEKDIKNKIAYLNAKSDASEKLSFTGKLAESLVLGRVPDISVLLEQIRTQFEVDDICIYAGNEMNLILSCGNAQSRSAAYLLENGYAERFSGDGIFALDNVNELEGRDDKALAILSEQNIGGALQYLITEDNMIKGMISYCYIGKFKKWAVNDISYLAIISRIVTALLKKNAYI